MEERDNQSPFYEMSGIVVHGRGIGKLVGMPTANLKVEKDINLPNPGVYISKVVLKGKTLYGITHIGERPTVDDSKDISFETHILNFNEDIYGFKIQVQLFFKIRLPQKFNELSSLLEQIRKDCVAVQEYWGIKQLASDLFMDIGRHQVKLYDHEIALSVKEFDVLYLLYSNPDVAFTKRQIYEGVWHEPANDVYHAVENTVFQIRKRIKAFSAGHDYIKTIVGYGYKYNA